MPAEISLETLIELVKANPKYQSINKDLIQQLCNNAIARGLTGKSAVKSVRNKLHQVGGAYFKQNLDVTKSQKIIAALPNEKYSEKARQFCVQQMKSHASTAERLPILKTFFQTCLEPVAPITSVMDLACGMNPMAIPWMPFAENFTYHACDIYEDLLGLIQVFFNHFNIHGEVSSCNLITHTPIKPVQISFLLKSIPCLEQMDKKIGERLLKSLNTQHILVSFPARSLGGRQKGMPDFYREHFYEMVSGNEWEIREFSFNSELAFLVTK